MLQFRLSFQPLINPQVTMKMSGRLNHSLRLSILAFAAMSLTAPVAIPSGIRLLNVSGRADVQAGSGGADIAGFIINGDGSRRLLLRGRGPTLASPGLTNVLADPTLRLHNTSDGSLIVANNNWRSSQETEIEQTGLAPSNDNESAIVVTLAAGAYTAVLEGENGSTGIGLVEVYDLDAPSTSQIANLSVRARVGTSSSRLIAGTIIGPGDQRDVVFRALGPSLSTFFGAGALQDPFLELRDGNGALLASNDDWQTAPNAIDIALSGLAPSNPKESVIMTPPGAGNYTIIVSGVSNGTGVGLGEIYKIN